MIGRFRAVSAEEMATILRLHHAEQWPVGTIATQIERHHDTVERVLAQSGLPVTKQSPRTRLVDPYLPFIHESALVDGEAAGLHGLEERIPRDRQ